MMLIIRVGIYFASTNTIFFDKIRICNLDQYLYLPNLHFLTLKNILWPILCHQLSMLFRSCILILRNQQVM